MKLVKKSFAVFRLLSVVILFTLFLGPVFAASQSWDGEYDATVTQTCDPWIIMDSWTVINNAVTTPNTTADIDQWDGARLELYSGSTRVEQVNFVFKTVDGNKTFTASWTTNQNSDGSGRQCQGTLKGTCSSGCENIFDLNGISSFFNSDSIFVYIFFFIAIVGVIFVVIIFSLIIRAVRRPANKLNVIDDDQNNQIYSVNQPPAVQNPPAPADNKITPKAPKTMKRRSKRKFTPVYGKKIFKKSNRKVNNRAHRT